MKGKTYQLELANKIRNGRAAGNLYVVTRRPIGRTGIVAQFNTREEAEAWIVQAEMDMARSKVTYELEFDHVDGFNGHTCDAYVVRVDGKKHGAYSYEAVARDVAERLIRELGRVE